MLPRLFALAYIAYNIIIINHFKTNLDKISFNHINIAKQSRISARCSVHKIAIFSTTNYFQHTQTAQTTQEILLRPRLSTNLLLFYIFFFTLIDIILQSFQPLCLFHVLGTSTINQTKIYTSKTICNNS